MATYLELHNLHSDSDMLARVGVAVVDAAITIFSEAGATNNHANRLIWAKEALSNVTGTAKNIYPTVLLNNKGATVGQIRGASDAAIQSNVDSVVDLFATG